MKEKIFTINITDETRTMRDEMLAQNLKGYLTKDGFQGSLDTLKEVQAQVLPDGEHHNTIVEEEPIDGFKVYSFNKPDYENIVLYIHGGAWVYEFFSNHVTLCDLIADKTNSKLYAPLYPLAPQYSYEDTMKMVLGLYDKLCEMNKPIFVMGDSAGGNITLCLVKIIKETGRRLPDRVVALSPCVDMTFSNPEAIELEVIDPLDAVYGCNEFGKMWIKGIDPKDPSVSPLYADVSGFPKTMLLAASNDILTPDIMKYYDKMVAAGVDVTLVRGEGLFHVFPSMPIPERDEFMDVLEKFCLF